MILPGLVTSHRVVQIITVFIRNRFISKDWSNAIENMSELMDDL